MKLTRKEFLRGTLAVAGGAVGLAATGTGCGGDDDGGGSGGGGSGGSCASTIESNHGHSLKVSAADVAAAVDKTYSIQGSSAHDHQVTLTAAHFADLGAGKQVFVTSTDTAAHNHNVSVTCA